MWMQKCIHYLHTHQVRETLLTLEEVIMRQ
ncbi:hypothetical protein ESCOMM224M_15145 [Escherichia coli]